MLRWLHIHTDNIILVFAECAAPFLDKHVLLQGCLAPIINAELVSFPFSCWESSRGVAVDGVGGDFPLCFSFPSLSFVFLLHSRPICQWPRSNLRDSI